MKLTKSLLAISIAAVLVGCGGGGGGGSSSGGITTPSPTPDNQKPDVVETNTISGRAADGYLQYATVCLDLNNNARCDADEPATISGDGGKFELTLADEQMAKLSSSRLVVETKAGVTVDEDYGVAIKRGYTLQAPVNVEKKGDQFVSPITSLVVSKMDTKGVTVEEAAEEVALELGAKANVMADYVAASAHAGADVEGSAYQKLYRLAQVLANAQALAEEALASEGVQDDLYKDALNAIYSRFTDLSGLVAHTVEQSMANSSFDPMEVLQSLNLGQRISITKSDLTNGNRLAQELFGGPAENPWLNSSVNMYGLYDLSFQQVDGKFYMSEEEWDVDYMSWDSPYTHSAMSMPRAIDADLKAYDLGDLNNSYWVWSSDTNNFEAFNEAPKGVVTGRLINMADGSKDRIFNTVKVDSEYRESIKMTSVAEVMETLYPGQVDPELYSQVGSELIYSNTNYIAIRETLAEDLYLGSFNVVQCDNGDVWACNTVPAANGSAVATALNEVVHASVPVGTETAIPATVYGKAGYGVQLIEGGNVVVRDLNVDDYDEKSMVATGTWENVALPFKHIRVSLPSGMTLNVGDTGFARGTPILFQHEGRVVGGEVFQKGLTTGEMMLKPKTRLLVNSAVRSRLTYLLFKSGNLVTNPVIL